MNKNNKNKNKNFDIIKMLDDRQKDMFAMQICYDWYNTFKFIKWNGNWESKKDNKKMCYRDCILKEVKTNKIVNKTIILQWDETKEMMWVHIGNFIN